MKKLFSISPVFLLILVVYLIGGAADVNITEWKVPWEDTRPRDPYVAPDGDVWLVGQRGDYLASFDLETEEFKKYDLEPGTGPHNLIVDEDGYVWYAGNRAAHIGRLDPEDGSIEKYPMPNEQARDPHTLVFNSEGDIWFTVQGGNLVGKLTVETGDVELIDVPTQRARPYGIKVDGNDRPWIALLGTNKLATVNPETMKLTEIELPREEANPRRLTLTSDGNVWYVDYSQGYLGKYNPGTESFEEWEMPNGSDSRPYGMASDDQDRIWMVETGVSPNQFVGFDSETEEFIGSTPIESGGGTVRHMYYHQPTQSVWFGTDTNYLGRAKVN